MSKTEEFTYPPLVDVTFVFFISLQLTAVSDFEDHVIFKVTYSRKLKRYEKNEGHIHQRGICKLFSFRHKMVVKPLVKAKSLKNAQNGHFYTRSFKSEDLKIEF